jgi:4'-phosphopantetheinyl transferase
MDRDEEAWQTPPRKLTLPANRLDLWRVSLCPGESRQSGLLGILSADETERAGRFHFEPDRMRFVSCRSALRSILALYLKMEPAELRFQYGAKGKPEIQEDQNPDAVRFNVSHSKDLALIGVSSGRSLGVDVEKLRPAPDCLELAERFFSEREFHALLELSADQRAKAFLACWTRKEAFIKANGDGLSYPLRDFSVSTTFDGPAAIEEVKTDPDAMLRWSLISLQPENEYVAAVAFENAPCQLRHWNWTLQI